MLRRGCAVVVLFGTTTALGGPALVGLAPAGEDARRAIAIGPRGEVYQPDGAGAWSRKDRYATATTLAGVGRTTEGVVATGDGVIYKLAPNGWSAIRLAQHGGAVMSSGGHAVAAVGKQVYALDRFRAGEPEKLAAVTAPVVAIGGGRSVVVATGAGVFRIAAGKPTAIAGVHATAFAGDRWAIAGDGALDLGSRKKTAWPAGAKVTAVRARDDGTLDALAVIAGNVVVLELHPGAPTRQTPVAVVAAGARPVDLVVDRAGRIVVAMSDGRLLVHTKDWAEVTVADAPLADHPGSPPATSQ